MIPLKDWTQIQGMMNQGDIFCSPLSPSQKPWSSHKCNRYFFPQDEIDCALTISRSPKLSHTSCHITIRKILDTIIFSLVFVPIKKIPDFLTLKNTMPLDLFLTLGTMEIQSSRFFQSNNLNGVVFLISYHSQNPNPTHIPNLPKVQPFSFSSSSESLSFSSSTNIKYTPHNLIPSLPKNIFANLLAKL